MGSCCFWGLDLGVEGCWNLGIGVKEVHVVQDSQEPRW